MTFDKLGLSEPLLKAITKSGYTTPTTIQAKAIPAILERKDLLAGAQTGTGKTAAFVLPILQILSEKNLNNQRTRNIRALILTPTRELAVQVEENVKTYATYLPFLKSSVIFGGVSIDAQIHKLRRGFDVLIATPGRLIDHIERRTVNLSNVEIFVLDEADRMLDMGFIKSIQKIESLLPKKRQTLLFSATSKKLKVLSDKLLHSPTQIEVEQPKTATDRIKQLVHPVAKQKKRELLSFLIGSKNWQQVLVFVRTKHGADRLTEQLNEDGLKASSIHGNKSQGARSRALLEFKKGRTRVLVATDVASRGLDINQLPHVVNFDLPEAAEDYVHRIGRTGRAGNEGIAISLLSIEDRYTLKDIERLLNYVIPQEIIPGFEPPAKETAVRAAPQRRSGGRSNSYDNSEKSKAWKKPGQSSGRARSGNVRSESTSGASTDRSKPWTEKSSGDKKFSSSDKPRSWTAKPSGEKKFSSGEKTKSWGDKPSGNRAKPRGSSENKSGFAPRGGSDKKSGFAARSTSTAKTRSKKW